MINFRKSSFSTIIAFSVFSLIFQSCEKAVADFYFGPVDNPESYETISFFNESVDAVSYEWNFGDGELSEEINPTHIFDWPGDYNVTLTSYDDRGSNSITKSIAINEPTVLQLEFFSSGTSGILGDCEVWLYDNENDWQEINRAQIYSYATFNGKCFLLNLEDQVYYVRVYKYTDEGVWEGSKVLNKLELNKTSKEVVYCEFTLYEDSF